MSDIEIDSQALDYRIYVHKHFSKSDFDAWLLNSLHLSPDMKVLDAGCGVGRHMFDISGRVGKNGAVLGMDISDDSLDKCRKNIEEWGAKNISLVRADFAEIAEKVAERDFDRIVSSFAVYYTKNPQKTFKDLYDLLKPGGEVFICGPTPKNNSEFLDLVKRAGGSFSEDFLHWSNFLEHDASDILRKLFKEVKTEYFNNPIEFPDADTLFKYWKATPLYNVLMENKMRELIAEEFKKKNTFISNKVIIGITCKKL
ncbi:MAG: class I SAM-dependent methyltransferase [bacterium]|nr:class I SAM-dependent methyltransferase [bacterium]